MKPAEHASHAASSLEEELLRMLARQARRALADAAAGYRRDPLDKDCAADATREHTLEFSLSAGSEKPPALGWFLGIGSTTRMDKALCGAQHVRAYAAARRDLGVSLPYECRPAGL